LMASVWLVFAAADAAHGEHNIFKASSCFTTSRWPLTAAMTRGSCFGSMAGPESSFLFPDSSSCR
jgi:hypothetical protein